VVITNSIERNIESARQSKSMLCA